MRYWATVGNEVVRTGIFSYDHSLETVVTLRLKYEVAFV
jgi:hypothetical protein